MDTIKMPCPTEGCDGDVYAALVPVDESPDWTIIRMDELPVVLCSQRCMTPEELAEPVEAAILAARLTLPT